MPDASDPNVSQNHDTGRPAVETTNPSAPPPPPPHAAPYQPPQPKGGGTLSKIMTSIVLPLLLVSLIANVYMGYLVNSMLGTGPSEVTYQPGSDEARIAIVPVEGLIDGSTTEFVRKGLKKLEQDPPEALILRVESGGGGVTASDQIRHQLNQFKQKNPDVPVVASFGGVAASGGYYVAMTADHIVAERTCTTGSIGVLAPVFTFAKTLEKLGVNEKWIKAPGSPKKGIANNLFRNWTDKDVTVVKDILAHMHQQFIDVVVNGRVKGRENPLTPEKIDKLAQGQTFNAKEAVSNHLVDEVGYLDAAIAKAKAMAGVAADVDPTVTELKRPQGILGSLFSVKQRDLLSQLDAEKLRSLFHEATDAKFMYRAPISAL